MATIQSHLTHATPRREGFERETDADFAHFLTIAKGSAGEVRSMLYLAEDRRYIESIIAEPMRREYKKLSQGIAQFAKYLRKKPKQQPPK